MVGLLPGGEGAKIIGVDNGHIPVDVVRAVGVLRIGDRDEGVGTYG
jgi:hypothetical protein